MATHKSADNHALNQGIIGDAERLEIDRSTLATRTKSICLYRSKASTVIPPLELPASSARQGRTIICGCAATGLARDDAPISAPRASQTGVRC